MTEGHRDRDRDAEQSKKNQCEVGSISPAKIHKFLQSGQLFAEEVDREIVQKLKTLFESHEGDLSELSKNDWAKKIAINKHKWSRFLKKYELCWTELDVLVEEGREQLLSTPVYVADVLNLFHHLAATCIGDNPSVKSVYQIGTRYNPNDGIVYDLIGHHWGIWLAFRGDLRQILVVKSI